MKTKKRIKIAKKTLKTPLSIKSILYFAGLNGAIINWFHPNLRFAGLNENKKKDN